MKIINKITDPNIIKNIINDGGSIIYPTETAYAIGTSINQIDKIYELKKRAKSKEITFIVSSLNIAKKYCFMNNDELLLCKTFMPGPLSLVCRKKELIPNNYNTEFVFRISSNKIANKLTKIINAPITSTSANISGEKTAYSIEEINKKLKEKVDLIIDTGPLEKKPTSTIVRIYKGKLEILREGPISKKEIEKTLLKGFS
jgi:L-threonylcarbamoyladenylate synthase